MNTEETTDTSTDVTAAEAEAMNEKYTQYYAQLLNTARERLIEIYPNPDMKLSVAMTAVLIHSVREHCADCRNSVVVGLTNCLAVLGELDLVQALSVLATEAQIHMVEAEKLKEAPPEEVSNELKN